MKGSSIKGLCQQKGKGSERGHPLKVRVNRQNITAVKHLFFDTTMLARAVPLPRTLRTLRSLGSHARPPTLPVPVGSSPPSGSSPVGKSCDLCPTNSTTLVPEAKVAGSKLPDVGKYFQPFRRCWFWPEFTWKISCVENIWLSRTCVFGSGGAFGLAWVKLDRT